MNTIREHLASAKNSKERKNILSHIRVNIASESAKYHITKFTECPIPEGLDDGTEGSKLIKIYRSYIYLVQVYNQNGAIRISVNKTHIDDNGSWLQGISWDDLMLIKRLIGYGDFDAVEVYPKDQDVVNVANMRHLFILNEPLDFIWRSK